MWKRGNELRMENEKHAHPFLFEGGIEPADIAQGQLGDCWLLSAFACMAEHPGFIQNMFLQREYNPRGKYQVRNGFSAANPGPRHSPTIPPSAPILATSQVRLFDKLKEHFVVVNIDDRIPCSAQTGKPCFTSPHGDELWVLLLEKAFAKFCGSYHALEGGQVLWALEAMSGCAVESFCTIDNDGTWTMLELRHKPEPGNKRKCSMGVTEMKKKSDEMYGMIKSYHAKGCVMGAGSKGKDETLTEGRGKEGGIVPGHAYTIVNVYESFGHKLIKLRNPWGTFEWDGDWSDKSDMWSKHKMVKQSVGFMAGGTKDVDDGSFWMAWDDFVKYFDCLDVCVLSKGLNELRLDPREDVGVCGPFFGCVLGCAWFWCACQGLAKMLCKRDGADKDEAAEIENLVAEGGGPAAAVGDLDIDMPTSPVV
mmetsp:Transcript_19063/g.50114  ORF Transcript_19063/g.50114 Transcript_19063/m.50114 type:complete len:422 (+) Transcript_19063:515-1780(+)